VNPVVNVVSPGVLTAPRLYVATNGNGTLNITAGGVVTTSSTRVEIGLNAGSNGIVRVNGIGSQLNAMTVIEVGRSDNGTLNIEDNAVVSSVSVSIGINPGSTGILNLRGGGTLVTGYIKKGDGNAPCISMAAPFAPQPTRRIH
jgi:T5SS/PEP-CTERM-associated repeat protein